MGRASAVSATGAAIALLFLTAVAGISAQEAARPDAGAPKFDIVAPVRMSAQNGTTLTLLGDGSIQLGGTIAATEVLRFELETTANGISGLRLETLLDASAPPGVGPGLSIHGNFVLNEIVVEEAPRNSDGFKPVLLERPSADFEQAGFTLVGAIDGVAHTGWAIAPRFGVAHDAQFETSKPLGYDAGVKLRLRLDCLFGSSHIPARLRFAVTTADRPLPMRREPTEISESFGRINPAIQRGTKWLLEQQELDGLWESRAEDMKHGMTALAGYTLLKCGVKRDHPAIRRAAARIACEPSNSTYSAGMELMFLGELADDALQGRVEETARRLLSWMQPGGFGYPGGGPDLSNGQYAALGLRAAAKRGVKIEPEAWIKLGDAVVKHMEKVTGAYEGAGFGYYAGGPPTGSMTAGGTCMLKIADEQLTLVGISRPAYATGWRRGVMWLDRYFTVDTNPRAGGGWLYYWLYGVERVGGLCDVAALGGKNWYREGAHQIIGAQKPEGFWDNDGGPQPTTCFALLFLARATSSVSGVAVRGENIYGDDDPARDVNLRASGDSPLTLWMSSFGGAAKLLEWPTDAGRGPRVAEVLYVTPGRTLLSDGQGEAAVWRVSEATPNGAFESLAFDDSEWRKAPGAFGDDAVTDLPVRSDWKGDEIWLRRELTLDDAPMVAPELRIAASGPRSPETPAAELVCLFDEDPAFAKLLVESSAGGTVVARETGGANGRYWLQATPQQVFSATIPGWRFPITEVPRDGEFRYLRLSWKKEGAGGVMVQVAANGNWGTTTRRFHAGATGLDWPSTALDKDAPHQWTAETIDLYQAFGGATMLTGLALVACTGGPAGFDAIYLARAPSHFESIPKSSASHAAVAKPLATTAALHVPGSDAVALLEIFVNGTLLYRGSDPVAPYAPVPTLRPLESVLQPGRNVVAVHARRGRSLAAIDVGIVDQRLLARVAGTGDQPAAAQRFAAQVNFEHNGSYTIRALARLIAPPDTLPPDALRVASAPIQVVIREAQDPELLVIAGDAGRNLLGPSNATARASSFLSAGLEAALAIDNLASRGWLCADGDRRPSLSIELKKPVRADTVLITPIQQRGFEPERQAWRLRRVEVSLDRGKSGTFEVTLPADGRKGMLRLPRIAVIRRVDVRLLDASDRPAIKDALGIGEVELQLRK